MPSRARDLAWFDRDLGWLAFNRRVLAQAMDVCTPLLERLKFLAISTSNLDEFFMKRMPVLRGSGDDPGHASPELLAAVRDGIAAMVVESGACLTNALDALAPHGIRVVRWADLAAAQREEASAHFERAVLPALTPQVVDMTHPRTYVSNLSLSWTCRLRDPGAEEWLFGRVPIASGVDPWFRVRAGVPADAHWFLPIADLVRARLDRLFTGVELAGITLVRVTRDADVEVDADDLARGVRAAVAESVRQRRYEPVIRAEFGSGADPDVRRTILERLSLTDADAYDLPGDIDANTLWTVASVDRPRLRDESFSPRTPPFAAGGDPLVQAIATGDHLVHHPYDSFDDTVHCFIEEAAHDPDTVSIKMTAYRLGDDTPFVKDLIAAAESGKQVACVIELQARFDEARNLAWADALLRAGAHVSFGVLGLKIHAKMALVVRREAGGLKTYCHIATGNYHQKTAKLYADFGLFTSDPVITADVVRLFHFLTGRGTPPVFDRLLVAPWHMRRRFIELIGREVEHRRAGRPARIVAKLNQVDDPEICDALCVASDAGVPVDLIVRGFCCLRPGVPGVTDSVRVRSIIGRFLEHSRVFHFANGEADPIAGDFYIGSADWMTRNLSHRIEAVVPVRVPDLRAQLWATLDLMLKDERQAWLMDAQGAYQPPAGGADGPGTHATLAALARDRD
jgi:polyphosphate kinase